MNEKKVGLALSGGGSRAIAFHYGVIEAFYELGIAEKIDVVSAISGGAIVGALFNSYSRDQNTFKEKMDRVLSEGLETSLYWKLLDPRWLFHQGIHPDALADVLDKKIFQGALLKDIPDTPILILNATDLKRGCNFKFGKSVYGSYKDGSFPVAGLRLSQAVAYSAAFTLCISVKKLILSKGNEVYLTDGGVYDALGANSLMPDKNDQSILAQQCNTVILSDASFPYQENLKGLSLFAKSRLESSFYCSGNRNRSLIYNKAFLLHQTGRIPYLGTIKMDSKHEDLTRNWSAEDLGFINKYRTDFKPVTGKAITLLKMRGKKEAEVIVKQYLSHLLN
jgi:NTE family protein